MNELAVDVGQTGIRVSWGGRTAVVETGVQALTDELRLNWLAGKVGSLADELAATPNYVGVGLSGFVEGSSAPEQLAGALHQAFGGARIAVAADAVTAYLGTLGLAAGTIAICGTGVAVLGFDGQRMWKRVDARGYLLGDFGSGFWIGQRGLHAAFDSYEGRGPETALARAATRLGGPAAIYEASMSSGGAPRFLASFAPDVFAAAQQGDPIATDIVSEAAQHIARSLRAGQLSQGPIGLTGGLVRSEAFVELIRRALDLPGTQLVSNPDAALTGARVLAARAHEALASFQGLVVMKETR